MKLNSSLSNMLVVVLALSPLIFLTAIWNRLPEIVPVHYDIHFKPDQMGSKNLLWMANGILSVVSVLVYFLLLNLHKIDPKRKNYPPAPLFKRIATGIVVFLVVLNYMLLLSINNNIKLSQKMLLIFLGLLFAFIGNYMNNIKPNYFAGLRLPWTLSSDYNWKKTHHLASKIWFWGGLLTVIITLLIPPAYSFQLFTCLVSVMIVIPVVYSYRLFKQENAGSGINSKP